MLERLKRALVESYIGAIALGYTLAQCIFHFVNMFSSPVGGWVARNAYPEVTPGGTGLPDFLLKYGLPEFVRFFLLLLVWYFLLRWLYFTPPQKETSDSVPNPERAG